MSTCKHCSCEITDSVLKKKYYDPEYPNIHIGPYCSNCITKVRVCTGCHVDHIIDETIKYFGKGRFYCTACAVNIEACGVCGSESTIHKVHDGVKYCESCFKKTFQQCDRCNEVKLKTLCITDDLIKKKWKGMFKSTPSVCKVCFDKDKSRYKEHDVSKCKNCGSFHTNPAEDKDYCKSCYDSFRACSKCGKKHPKCRSYSVDRVTERSALKIYDGYYNMCPSCKGRASRCESCKQYTFKPQKVRGRIKTYSVCNSCTVDGKCECPSCLSLQSTEAGKPCHDCCTTYYNNKCPSCKMIRDDRGTCRNCGGAQIYNYTFKPRTAFWYTKLDIKRGDNTFLGIENEVTFGSSDSTKNSKLRALYKSYDPTILLAKSDGSIHGSGFEIVTQPMTLASIHSLDVSSMFWPEMKKDSSCGLHIHVGRNAFKSDTHIYKVVEFIHNNEKFIDTIAERSYSNYNGKLRGKPSKAVKDAKGGSASRNARINLSNPNTIEFRMFAGAVSEFNYRYKAEFIHALVSWAGLVPISVVKVKSFFSYVEKNSKQYPNLYRFMTKKCQRFTS